ncbi:SIR2 family protein [Anaerotruncus rubiinfantis]|uniref:SIR2 family protein n=1 Tax=Anaerotruncus rubiinfantis TaxID=1720200 RepID=UPI0018970127|nr:SIR2 family protein [Anaerotruncus rubiinfantis]
MGDNAWSKNVVKVRDDKTPLCFHFIEEKDDEKIFELDDGQMANWIADNKFSEENLRGRVEPWLTSLFQSEHLSLLVGSGLTSAVQFSATDSSGNGMGNPEPKSCYKDQIVKEAAASATRTGRGSNPNIEDYIRVMNELLRGLDIIGDKANYDELKTEIKALIKDFTDNISAIEAAIASADEDKRNSAFNKLVLFLMSFASRTGTRDRLNIFTTNYDRLIEAGADIAGLHLIDRFVGALTPIFRSSRMDIDLHYNPPGIRGEPRYLEGVARYTKLHGSVDWVSCDNTIRRIGLPFGAKDITPFLGVAGIDADASKIMIYPNASKDKETAEYPYVELFRDFAAALCRPNSTVVTYGYSFGDDHINRIIRDMLTIPSTHLVVIAYNDEAGRIKRIYDEWGRCSQISLIIGKDIASLDALVDYYLPKPAIDRTTIRMADLLRQRYDHPSKPAGKEGSSEE